MSPDLSKEIRFERFAARAVQEGLGSVYSFPLRIDGRRFGALDLYSRTSQAAERRGARWRPNPRRCRSGVYLQRRGAGGRRHICRRTSSSGVTRSADKLPNRALLEDRLALALAKSRRSGTRTGLMFLDLDRFKAVNDNYGHLVGDRLLIAVGDRLTSTLRAGDTLARVAGDEFVVVCEEIADLEHAEQVAARIHAVLKAPFAIEPNSITISASIGIAVATDRDEEAADLLLHADGALYDAKHHGGGQSKSATERARTETSRRFNVERDLRDAIENDELQLVYQPIFELSSGRAARVEALLRWTHPQLGEIAAPYDRGLSRAHRAHP